MSRARSVSRVGVETTLTISSNGNVGFGSTIPRTRVDVAGNLNVSGVITATSFVGNLTGTAPYATSAGIATTATTALGLSGTPDITVGIVTATVISAGSTVGTAGSVLTSTGTGLQWTSVAVGPQVTAQLASLSNLIGYNNAGLRSDAANGRLEVFGTGNFRVFTSPGTFVVNPGISSIRVRVVGAGGNGGASGSGGPPNAYYISGSGGGGGGGGYAHKVITSFSVPRTYTVTVGSAPGGTSSFGAEVSATGGSNGTAGTPSITSSPSLPGGPGGSGGTGSGGDVNYTGATGTTGSNGGYFLNSGYGGPGGSAGTQKGNASGASVPGLPSFSIPPSTSQFNSPTPFYYTTQRITDNRYVSRFPFDIFTGTTGNISFSNISPTLYVISDPTTRNGTSGGEGAFGNPVSSGPIVVVPGGNGGDGAGGGGGNAMPYSNQSPGGLGGNGGFGGGGGGGGGIYYTSPGFPGTSGGAGGSGIVIVEW